VSRAQETIARPALRGLQRVSRALESSAGAVVRRQVFGYPVAMTGFDRARRLGYAAVLAGMTCVGCGSTDATTPAQGGPCVPNDDGVIAAHELNAAAGVSGLFSRATGVPVNTAPTVSAGETIWDFTGPYPGEQLMTSTLESMSDKWFAGDFPDASYAWWLESDDLYAVYRLSEGSVLLLGYASQTDEATATSVTHYDPPLVVFRTPLSEGDGWQTTSRLTGSSPFGPIDYTDGYAVSVDGRGTMLAPAGSFQVVRVNALATRDESGDQEAHRQHYYLTECLGIVGAVVSETVAGNQAPADFTMAEEIARLGQ
jgi:hypothetical protein